MRGRAVLDVAVADLEGRIAEARGDEAAAVTAFTDAVAAEDRLGYNEPPDWLLTERERLGALLLRRDGPRTPSRSSAPTSSSNVGNPRSLFGLWKSLDAQKKPTAAEARRAFETAFAGADVVLEADLHGRGAAATASGPAK